MVDKFYIIDSILIIINWNIKSVNVYGIIVFMFIKRIVYLNGLDVLVGYYKNCCKFF